MAIVQWGMGFWGVGVMYSSGNIIRFKCIEMSIYWLSIIFLSWNFASALQYTFLFLSLIVLELMPDNFEMSTISLPIFDQIVKFSSIAPGCGFKASPWLCNKSVGISALSNLKVACSGIYLGMRSRASIPKSILIHTSFRNLRYFIRRLVERWMPNISHIYRMSIQSKSLAQNFPYISKLP